MNLKKLLLVLFSLTSNLLLHVIMLMACSIFISYILKFTQPGKEAVGSFFRRNFKIQASNILKEQKFYIKW